MRVTTGYHFRYLMVKLIEELRELLLRDFAELGLCILVELSSCLYLNIHVPGLQSSYEMCYLIGHLVLTHIARQIFILIHVFYKQKHEHHFSLHTPYF